MNYRRTFSPLSFHYKPDGGGRDTYILANNGGMANTTKIMPGMRSKSTGRGYSPPKPVLQSPHKRYVTNGSGRDTYVDDNRQKQQKFWHVLRQYQHGILPRLYSPKEKEIRMKIGQQQILDSNRLSLPREKREKNPNGITQMRFFKVY